ncbi:hypothetical protein C0J52_15087 [Blattella germanica]|nr:hypothetical protein C0J52_15087 [Blattella germanica]
MNEIREEVHEYGFFNDTMQGGTHVLQTSPTTSQKRAAEEDENEWTTWELYNFVLKGMVDELITLGANKEIKVTVLQLWTRYLQLLEIAFISKTNELCLPKLSLPYHQRDARIIYEQRKRRRKKRKKLKAESITSSPYASARTLKKTFLQAQYERSCSEAESDAISMLNESLKSTASQSSTSKRNFTKNYFNKAVKDAYKSDKKERYSNSIHVKCHLTRKTLIAILYIALLMVEDKIQLSDLIRWIEEGTLSYHEVTQFFPHAQKLKGQDVITFGITNQRLTHSGVREITKDMLTFLKIKYIKMPDLIPLASRYVEELQLPAEILKLVERLIYVAPALQESSLITKNFKSVPNVEGRAMGLILVVLKLLMGLDGKTEYKQSDVAERINGFELVCEIELNLYLFTEMNPDLVEAMKSIMEKLQHDDFVSKPEFVSSLTPLKSNLEFVLTSELDTFQLSSEVLSILHQDFTETTLDYLLDPKRYVVLAREHGIKINVSNKSAQEKVIFREIKVTPFFDFRKKRVIKITNKIGNQSKRKRKYSEINSDSRVDDVDDDSGDCIDINSCRESDDDMFENSQTFKTLPVVAENILFKHLQQVITSGKEFIGNVQQTGECKSDYTLYMPMSKYWMTEISCPKTCIKEFEDKISPNFPPSFLWLLKQCAGVLCMTIQDLYKEVSDIEVMHLCNYLVK